MNLAEALSKCEKGKPRKKAADLTFLKNNKGLIIQAYHITRSPKNIFDILCEHGMEIDYLVFRRWLYRNLDDSFGKEIKKTKGTVKTEKLNEKRMRQVELISDNSLFKSKSKFTQTYDGDDI